MTCVVCHWRFLQLRLLVVAMSLPSSVYGFVHTAYDSLVYNSSLRMSSKATSDDWQFHVAPMQCYTNAPLRTFLRTLSDDAVLWSEMEKLDDLLEASLERQFGRPGHKNMVLQLGGNDSRGVRKCLRRLSNEGYTFDEINLNCGCPSIETGGAASYGASLMKDPELTRDLLQSIVSLVDCKVSLKCRIAVVESVDKLDSRNQEEDYVKLHNYVQYARDAGIDHLVLHARSAVLAGLNPTKNRQVPHLDYSMVERIAKDFSDLRVTLNGGIQSIRDLEECVSQENAISSHMAGRWMLRRPLDLAQVKRQFGTSTSANKKLSTCIDDYRGDIDRILHTKDTIPLSELCLPLYLVSEQLREDLALFESNDDDATERRGVFLTEHEFDELYSSIKDVVEMIASIGNRRLKKMALPEHTNFKKLSASFKDLIGTKVANKWKRNRSEM